MTCSDVLLYPVELAMFFMFLAKAPECTSQQPSILIEPNTLLCQHLHPDFPILAVIPVIQHPKPTIRSHNPMIRHVRRKHIPAKYTCDVRFGSEIMMFNIPILQSGDCRISTCGHLRDEKQHALRELRES